MPYSFILQTIFFASLGMAVIVIARALPRVEDEMVAKRSVKGRIESLISKMPLDRMDETLNIFFHKILRRLKVVILKADNIVSSKLHGLKGSERKGSNLPTSGMES